MTEELVAMSPPSSKSSAEPVADISADRPDPGGLLARRPVDAGAVPLEDQELELARELVRQARASGMALTGPGGLLKSVTKLVIETALEEAESRAPRLWQARHGGPRPGQLPQWQAAGDGADRRRGRGGDRSATGSGEHVRAGDRPSCASAGCPIPTRSC